MIEKISTNILNKAVTNILNRTVNFLSQVIPSGHLPRIKSLNFNRIHSSFFSVPKRKKNLYPTRSFLGEFHGLGSANPFPFSHWKWRGPVKNTWTEILWYIFSLYFCNWMLHDNYMKSWAKKCKECLETHPCMTLKLLIKSVHFPLCSTQYVPCLSKLVQTVFPGVPLQTLSSPNSMHCFCNFWILNSYTWKPPFFTNVHPMV